MSTLSLQQFADKWQRAELKERASYQGKWHAQRTSPTRQARRNAASLSQLLATNQIKQWITPVIIWANPESTVTLDNPSADVWTLDQLSEHLKALSGGRPLSDAQAQRIVAVLERICQARDAEL